MACPSVACGVVWCGVLKVLLPKGNGRDVYPRVQVNGRAVCVSRTLCVVFVRWSSLLCHFVAAAGPVRLGGGGGGLVRLPGLRRVGGAAFALCPPPSASAPSHFGLDGLRCPLRCAPGRCCSSAVAGAGVALLLGTGAYPCPSTNRGAMGLLYPGAVQQQQQSHGW